MIAGGFFGAGLGYALPAVISGGIGSATEAALVGAVVISPEEAIIMGVAVGGGVAVAVNGFFDPNTMGDNIAYYQRKPAAPRIHCGSRKEAYDKAFQKGGKKKLSYIRRVAGIII